MRETRGFSLVEVAISTTVLATAALLLSASLSAANAQKAAARRQGLAKSLALRQLELFQQRITEARLNIPHAGLGSGASSGLRLDALRGSGRIYRIANDGGPNPYSPHMFCYRNQDGQPVSGGTSYQVPVASNYHVMFPSTNARATPTTAPNPPGSMFPDEIERINGEQLAVELYVAACQTDGNRDNPAGNDPISVNMTNTDLLIAQVVVRDTTDNNEMFTLSRMFRVMRRQQFPLEGQF